MELNGALGAIYKLAEWIYHLVFLNILWLLFNLPILFLGLNLLLSEEIEVILTLMILIGCMLPFLFFPSTFAMFRVMIQIVNKEDVSLFRGMISNVRKSYTQLLSMGWICTIFWVVLFIDIVYMVRLGEELAVIIFLCIAFFAGIYQLFLFGCIDETTSGKKLFIYTASKMVKKPIITITIGMLSFGLFFVSLSESLYFFILISGSLICFMTTYLLQKS